MGENMKAFAIFGMGNKITLSLHFPKKFRKTESWNDMEVQEKLMLFSYEKFCWAVYEPAQKRYLLNQQ